jgi:hypothetical protein
MAKKSKPQVDLMIWMHLGKLGNIADQIGGETAEQMHQSINRIVAILHGEHKQEDEPESVRTLQALREWFNQREAA